MNITQAKGYVRDTVRAYLSCDGDGLALVGQQLQRPLFLIGPPGIGKTAIMAQVARELEIGLVSYSMTHHTRQSALGLPVVEHREYRGFEYDASEYTMSEIIASLYDYMRNTGLEQGILFLDEVNCVSETLYPSMLQFLQFKTFGKHAVPSGWVIVCAGNPPEYNRSVHEFDVVTLDRIRRIEVEPDFDAWKSYAADAGVHPAVMTFLETERDCFYRIESTPGGKRFVTARGWDDLSRMVSLNERLGLPVERELFEQFVQDPDIAEQFGMYYDLFCKYQSDYEVPAILAGTESENVRERARAARIDERMALIGLLVDALVPQAADVQLREAVLSDVRDVLRGFKESALEGGSAVDPLREAAGQRDRRVERIGAANVRDETSLRVAMRSSRLMGKFMAACRSARLEAGEEAFLCVHQEFRGHVGAFEADVAAFREKLDNAYTFLQEAFGDGNELLLFTTEITARKATAHFVSRYGCDAFARSSQDLQVAERSRDLLERMDALYGKKQGEDGAAHASEGRGDVAGGRLSEPDVHELSSYYEHARWEFGYASLCHMALPSGLSGKTVLDVGCRRGKGVFKLSDRVGAGGRAIGIDWVAQHIEEAESRMERAAHETGLPANNMEFHLGYPEDLLACGIGDNTVDMAFVNSVLHLTCDPDQVIREVHRVLRQGGLLVCEVALASARRDRSVVDAARKLGNSIQAAPDRASFERWLEREGFTWEVVEGPEPVEASMGFKRGHEAPVVATDEPVRFEALVIHATKS